MSSEPTAADVWDELLDPQGDFSLPDFTAVTPDSLIAAAQAATDFALSEVDHIVTDETDPTFATATVRFESATVPMARLAALVRTLESNHLTPELTDAVAEVWVRLSATRTEMLLGVDLFHRIEQVPVTDLNPEDKRHQELTIENFVRAGARLGEEDRAHMATIEAELTALSTSFSRALGTDTRELAVHLQPLWDLFVDHGGSLRVGAAIAEQLDLVPLRPGYRIYGEPAEAAAEQEAQRQQAECAAAGAGGHGVGDESAAAQTAPQHYVIRTSWVFGEGENFMSTMRRLANKGVEPKVIHDQRGRPTFAEDLAKGIVHLLTSGADYGVYNLSNSGDTVGRDEIAMAVFIGLGHDPAEVTPVSTEQYREIAGPEAPRPKESTLALDKIEATGFKPQNWRAALALYLALYPED